MSRPVDQVFLSHNGHGVITPGTTPGPGVGNHLRCSGHFGLHHPAHRPTPKPSRLSREGRRRDALRSKSSLTGSPAIALKDRPSFLTRLTPQQLKKSTTSMPGALRPIGDGEGSQARSSSSLKTTMDALPANLMPLTLADFLT